VLLLKNAGTVELKYHGGKSFSGVAFVSLYDAVVEKRSLNCLFGLPFVQNVENCFHGGKCFT